MARRSDHTREELKDLILSASWAIVAEEGQTGLTARRIAARIGYAPGTIYNLFSAMDDLYLHVNGMTLDRLYAALSGASCNNSRKTPVQNMKEMARLYRDFARENRPHWLMLFTHAPPADRPAPEWYHEKIARLFEPLERLLEPFYTGPRARKRKMAARVLWAAVHGLCFLEETGRLPIAGAQETTPDMTGYLIDTFTAGIAS